MDPVNNCNATNEISDEFLKKKYGITEQYSKDFPESSAIALSTARCAEEALQEGEELRQNAKEHSNGMTRLIESSEAIQTRLDNIIESSENNTQALRNLAISLSELKEMTSNIANFAKRFFKPVGNRMRNGFYLLTGRRELAAVLPRENQLAIEDNQENTISDADPTNQTSGNEKKKFANSLKFFMSVVGFYMLYSKAQRILCYSSTDP